MEKQSFQTLRRLETDEEKKQRQKRVKEIRILGEVIYNLK